jgi:hypothetical protein
VEGPTVCSTDARCRSARPGELLAPGVPLLPSVNCTPESITQFPRRTRPRTLPLADPTTVRCSTAEVFTH